MALTLITGPATEPVSLAEAKLQCRIDTSITDEDTLITSLITAARQHAERFTHRAFVSQVWQDVLDAPPCEVWQSPLAPVLSIDSVTYIDTNGDTQTWSSTLYLTDIPAGPTAGPARLTPVYGGSWPDTQDVMNAFTVQFTTGYASLPADIVAAIKLLVGHLYANREAVSANGLAVLPLGVEQLLWPYKHFA